MPFIVDGGTRRDEIEIEPKGMRCISLNDFANELPDRRRYINLKFECEFRRDRHYILIRFHRRCIFCIY